MNSLADAAKSRAKALADQLKGAKKSFLERIRRAKERRGAGDIDHPRDIIWLWISKAPRFERVSITDPVTGKERMVTKVSWPKGVTYDKGRNQMKRQRREYEQSLKGPSSTYKGVHP
jgi:hypothetical protein